MKANSFDKFAKLLLKSCRFLSEWMKVPRGSFNPTTRYWTLENLSGAIRLGRIPLQENHRKCARANRGFPLLEG